MDPWSFDPKFFGLAIDAFAGGPLIVHGLVERAGAIHQKASASSSLIVDFLPAPFSFQELLMLAGLSSCLREEQRATVAQSTIAIGVSIGEGGDHIATRRFLSHSLYLIPQTRAEVPD